MALADSPSGLQLALPEAVRIEKALYSDSERTNVASGTPADASVVTY